MSPGRHMGWAQNRKRRLTRLAAHHCAEQLGAELARLRVDQRGHLMGFLYVDGHVRAYHGQRAIASKAYVARRHMRGFKIAHARLGKQLRTARARVAQLFEPRRDLPTRVEVRDLNERAVVPVAN